MRISYDTSNISSLLTSFYQTALQGTSQTSSLYGTTTQSTSTDFGAGDAAG